MGGGHQKFVYYARHDCQVIRATHLANPPDIFIARLLVESKVFIQAKPNVVPIQSIREFAQVE